MADILKPGSASEISKEDRRPVSIKLPKGGTIVITDPKDGFSVILAGVKRLRMEYVGNQPRYTAMGMCYLLMDCVNPFIEYKGLREEEIIKLGKDDHSRFTFPGTVSHSHVQFKIENGKIIVTDLDSANGTEVSVPLGTRYEIKAPEKPISLSRAETIWRFKEYARTKLVNIKKLKAEGYNLEDIIYSFFCIDDSQKPDKDYPEKVDMVAESLRASGFDVHHPEVNGAVDMDHYYCVVNGKNGETHGRIYFNFDANQMAEIFKDLLVRARNSNLNVSFKIVTEKNNILWDTGRSDKIILYFNSKDQAEVLDIAEKVYSGHSRYFREQLPAFCAQLRDSFGNKMVGVGFGEQPSNQRESFTKVRTKILAGVLTDALNQNMLPGNGNFDFEGSFARQCTLHQVDPVNPVFNAKTSSKSFQAICERII